MRFKPVAAALCTLVIPVLLAGCLTSNASPHATPTPTPLGPLPSSVALPTGSAFPFAIEGNVLAFAGVPGPESACPRNDVYLANVRRYHPRVIWQGPPCAVVSDIHISPKWVVWEAGVSPAGSVWAFRRSTGHVFRVAGQPRPVSVPPCGTVGCLPNLTFDLSQNIAVWSQSVIAPGSNLITSSVLAKRLPVGQPKILYQTTLRCELETQPQLSGGRLVWLRATWPSSNPAGTKCLGTLQLNVMSERIDSVFRSGPLEGSPSGLTQITTSGDALGPQTNGRYISWLDTYGVNPSCFCSNLLVYDPTNGKVLTAARSVALGSGYIGFLLSGNLLVWIQERPNSQLLQAGRLQAGRLHLMNVRTISTSGLPATRRFIRTLGWVSGRRIVWELDSIMNAVATVRVGIRDVG